MPYIAVCLARFSNIRLCFRVAFACAYVVQYARERIQPTKIVILSDFPKALPQNVVPSGCFVARRAKWSVKS